MSQTGIKIVHIRRSEYDIYIGRPSKGGKWGFGNPFVIGPDGPREDVINKYKEWLTNGTNFSNKDATPERREWILENLNTLKCKSLGCFCNYPFEDCHGRILKELIENDN
jgi:hypothetical protein